MSIYIMGRERRALKRSMERRRRTLRKISIRYLGSHHRWLREGSAQCSYEKIYSITPPIMLEIASILIGHNLPFRNP